MSAPYTIDPSQMATVLTSCGRFDLLAETINSFREHFQSERIIVAEDAGRPEAARAFAAAVPDVDMRVNAPKLGQMRSIDKLYATLATPYALHLEDDWGFTRSIDLAQVTALLDSRDDISVICIAHREFDAKYARHARRETHAGIDYLVWDLDVHAKWFSYSFNPSVVRLDLWREIGPFERFITEENLSLFCKQRGMRIAMVAPGVAHHIGDDRHAHDPFQPPRAKTFIARLRRSVAKRWPNMRPGERLQCL